MPYLKELKKVKPTPYMVIAHLSDEDERNIPIKKTNKSVKWNVLESVLDGLSWDWLEAIDENENCVWTYTPNDSEDENTLERVKVDNTRDSQLLKVLIEAQAMVLSEVRQSQEVLVNGYRDLTEVLVDRVSHLEEKHAVMLDELAKMNGAKMDQTSGDQSIQQMLLEQVIGSMSPQVIGGLVTSLTGKSQQKALTSKNEKDE